MGDGMATDQAGIWQSKESVGSNESLASNASIPLPVPVRTRSARGGSESGYSSDTYNAMTIRLHYLTYFSVSTCRLNLSKSFQFQTNQLYLSSKLSIHNLPSPSRTKSNILFQLCEQAAGAGHLGGSSLNRKSREHAEHTVRVAAGREEEKQGASVQFLVKAVSLLCVPGSAWQAEECGEEGSEHL